MSTMRDDPASRRFFRKLEGVVKQRRLWKLQTVGREKLDFLYGDSDQDDSIELRARVAYCFRQFADPGCGAFCAAQGCSEAERRCGRDARGPGVPVRGREERVGSGKTGADGFARREVLLL